MKRLLVWLFGAFVLLSASEAWANWPPGGPGDTWPCTGAATVPCLTINDGSTSGTGISLQLKFKNGIGLKLTGDNGTAISASLNSGDVNSSVVAAFNFGTGDGMVASSVTGRGITVSSGSGTGASITGGAKGIAVGSTNGDAISVGGVAVGASGVYSAPSSDSWGGYFGNASATRPSLFSYGSGLGGWAQKSQGFAGGTSSWIVSSDARLKTEIEDSPYGLAELMKLKPIKYRLKPQKYKARNVLGDDVVRTMVFEKQAGFTAQNLREAIPEAVVTDPETGMLGATYSGLDPLLVAAIQQQQSLIDALTKRLAAVEASVKP